MIEYTPPFDSPIENIFAQFYIKYAAEDILFTPQVKVVTLCGRFVIDFVVTDANGYRVGIECDGKEFHNPSRDEWRDAMILGEAHVDVMYRLRGRDITYVAEDILYLLAILEPTIFNERARANLGILASSEVRNFSVEKSRERYHLIYNNGDDTGDFSVECRRREMPINKRCFWQSAYRYTLSIGGGDLDDVISKYRNL